MAENPFGSKGTGRRTGNRRETSTVMGWSAGDSTGILTGRTAVAF